MPNELPPSRWPDHLARTKAEIVRTILAAINVLIASLVALKVFEII